VFLTNTHRGSGTCVFDGKGTGGLAHNPVSQIKSSFITGHLGCLLLQATFLGVLNCQSTSGSGPTGLIKDMRIASGGGPLRRLSLVLHVVPLTGLYLESGAKKVQAICDRP